MHDHMIADYTLQTALFRLLFAVSLRKVSVSNHVRMMSATLIFPCVARGSAPRLHHIEDK